MNKQEKEVIQAQLDAEKAILEKLERQYKQSLNDIINKTKIIQADIDMLQASGSSDDKTLSMVRSKVYQKQYQEALKKQIEGILDKLHSDEFSTIQAYLNGCYEDGYLGTLYDISSQGEGVPIITSLDQNAIVKAVQLDSKISGGLYKSLGVDVAGLKRSIKAEISRGIASSLPYSDIARNITNVSNAPRSRAKTIVRTEGHRIQQQSAEDARQSAKDRGLDVVRVWDATLDGKTRSSHRSVDGEICELDGKFSNGLRYPGDPSGTAAEVVNCRCVALTKERWDAEGGFLKRDNFTGEIVSFDSPADYQEYKKKYWSKENTDYMDYVESLESKYETKDFKKVMENMTDDEYGRYKKLEEANPLLKTTKEKRKTSEGIFDTFNNTGADSIRPHSIKKEMNKSDIGKELMEYLEKNNVPVKLYYGVDNPKNQLGIYDPFDDSISVFCDVTKTIKETSKTVIHEATHRKLSGSGLSAFDEEVECFKAEAIHEKGVLTDEDISSIIKLVKKLYPEFVGR